MFIDLRGLYKDNVTNLFNRNWSIVFKSGERPTADETALPKDGSILSLLYDDNFVGECFHGMNAVYKEDGTGYDVNVVIGSRTFPRNSKGWTKHRELGDSFYTLVPKIDFKNIVDHNTLGAYSLFLSMANTAPDIFLRRGISSFEFVAESPFQGLITTQSNKMVPGLNQNTNLTLTNQDGENFSLVYAGSAGAQSGEVCYRYRITSADGGEVSELPEGKYRFNVSHMSSNRNIRLSEFTLYTENEDVVSANKNTTTEITHAILVPQGLNVGQAWRESTPAIIMDVGDVQSGRDKDIVVLNKKPKHGEEIEVMESKFFWRTI